MNNTLHVPLTPDALAEFKRLYEQTLENKCQWFAFMGKTYSTGYARYIIQDVEEILAHRKLIR